MSTLPAHDSHASHDDGHGHGHDHPWYLAHHWENPKQQFEAGKLGMWLFLATEVLLFGGLFCAYAVWRGNHPELFKYGSQFLDTTWGAINTCVLILSSLTMAWAVTAAQQGKQGVLKVMLILTLLGAVGFLAIKYVEYSHKFHEGFFPGLRFYQTPPEHSSFWGGHHDDFGPGVHEDHQGEAAHDGHDHAAGASSEHPAADSTHAAASPSSRLPHTPGANDTAATAPVSTTAPATGDMTGDMTGATAAPTVAGVVDPNVPTVELPQFPQANVGPSGLASDAELVEKPFALGERHTVAAAHPLRDAEHRPLNAHKFFDIYFMMTGLHGIHVVIGMIVIIWLLVGAFRGKFTAEYFTPVDLGGLYWHIVDLIWIFLFPLFYLI